MTIETGYCSVCGRPRNLRSEEHQLGNFVRTVVTCETCHRTLSSTMGVAGGEAAAEVEAPAAEAEAAPAPASEAKPAKRTIATKTASASSKPKATKTRAAKSK